MLCSASKLLERIRTHFKRRRNSKKIEPNTVADLAAITRIYEAGNGCLRTGPQGCLDGLLEAAVAFAGADKSTLHIYEPETGTLSIVKQRGFDASFLSTNSSERALCCGACLETRTQVVIEDVEASPFFADAVSQQTLSKAGVRAMQSAPLLSSTGTLLGILSTHFAQPYRPSEAVLRLIDLLARQAANYLERKKIEDALGEREVLLHGQHEALKAAMSGAPLQTSLAVLVSTATDTIGQGVRAAFYLANDERTKLHHVVGMGGAYAAAIDGFRIGPESLSCGLAAHSGHAVLTRDVTQEPLWKPWLGLAEQFDFRGCWSFPIHNAEGALVGTLAIYSQQPRAATERDVKFISLLTQTAAMIIARHNEAAARKLAENKLTANLQALMRMQALSGRIAGSAGENSLFQEIMNVAVEIVHADKGTLQIVEGDTLRIIAHTGHERPFLEFFSAAENVASVCGEAGGQGKRITVADVEASPIFTGSLSLPVLRNAGVRAVQSTPLCTRNGRLLGVLTTQWSQPYQPDEQDCWRLDLLARQAADFIEQQRGQAALSMSEARFRAFTKATSDVVYRMNADWTEMKHLQGRDFVADMLESSSIWLDKYIYPGDQGPMMDKVIQSIGCKQIFELEHRVIRMDGSIGWTHSRAIPIFDGNGEIAEWFGTASDITQRKQLEEALRESEEKYRTLFSSIDEGFCTIEVLFDESGKAFDYRLLEANPAYVQQTGLENAIGKTVRELEVGLEEFWFETYGRIARTGEAMRFEHEASALGKFYDVYAFRLGRPEDNRVAVLFEDISERKLGEEALRASEKRLRHVLDTDGVGVLFFNQEGYITDANQAFLRMTGYERKDIDEHQLHWRTLTPPEHIAESEAQLRKFAATQRIGPYEKEYFLRDGSKSWMLFAGSDLGDGTIVEFCVDINERKRAEAAFQEADARFRAMADTAPVLIWETDLGGVTFVNAQYLDFFGVDFDAVVGKGWIDFLHPDDKEDYLAVCKNAFASRSSYTYDCRFRSFNGQFRWLRNAGQPLNGHRFVGCSIDITERIQAEEALKEANRRKDEFLATLAHELRNPLAPISNGLHILQSPGIDPAIIERTHAIMQRQVNHMVKLVDELMEISRITRGQIELHKEMVDLAEVLQSAMETSRPFIDKAGHQLAISLPSEPLILEADKVRLAQVLTNILNNAAKYTLDGGNIGLSAWRERTQAVVSIRDNGMGIPAEMLPRVFDLFSQADKTAHKAQGGMGIGLTLARSLVNLHGGSIQVSSEGADKGTEVVVRLPLAKNAMHSGMPDRRESQPINLTSHRILVVDDNKDAADSLALLLTQLAAEVVAVNDGPAALEMLTHFWPSAVLLDIGMPGMDGYEVARRIRRLPKGENLMLIALTGWGQDGDRQKSKEAGINHHLVKPVNLEALKELLGSVAEESAVGEG